MTLNDKEYHVIVSRIMFKSDFKLAIKWLESKGYKNIKQAEYYRILSKLDVEAKKRLYELGEKFEIVAADEIVKFLNIEKQMYEEYHKEENPLNRARILQMIANLQPYITSLYDQTKKVIEGDVIESVKEDNILSKHPA